MVGPQPWGATLKIKIARNSCGFTGARKPIADAGNPIASARKSIAAMRKPDAGARYSAPRARAHFSMRYRSASHQGTSIHSPSVSASMRSISEAPRISPIERCGGLM